MKLSLLVQYHILISLLFTQYSSCWTEQKKLTAYELQLAEDFSYQSLFLLGSKIYKNSGVYDKALSYLQAAVFLEPSNSQARTDLAEIYLILGDYRLGFSNYKYHWIHDPSLSYKLYTGQDLKNKTVLIKNQGDISNLINYSRYLHLLKKKGAKIIIQLPAEYIPLFKQNIVIDQLISTEASLPIFDFQIPVTYLPELFQTTIKTMPTPKGYLEADSKLVDFWSSKLPKKQFKICFYLEGNGQGSLGESYEKFPINHLANLIIDSRVQVYSLRKKSSYNFSDFPSSFCGDPNNSYYYQSNSYSSESDYKEYQYSYSTNEELLISEKLIFFPEEIDTKNGELSDAAAILKNIDLFITDNATRASLAGALGVKTYLILPTVNDWFLLLNRHDSPWYETIFLHRQHIAGKWNDVAAKIISDVGAILDFHYKKKAKPPNF